MSATGDYRQSNITYTLFVNPVKKQEKRKQNKQTNKQKAILFFETPLNEIQKYFSLGPLFCIFLQKISFKYMYYKRKSFNFKFTKRNTLL